MILSCGLLINIIILQSKLFHLFLFQQIFNYYHRKMVLVLLIEDILKLNILKNDHQRLLLLMSQLVLFHRYIGLMIIIFIAQHEKEIFTKFFVEIFMEIYNVL